MIEFPKTSWADYELLDSGDGEKLERFGSYVLARPEPKALWDKSMTQAEWGRLSHTRFKPGAGFGKAGKEDSGTWERIRKMDDQWWIRYPLNDPDEASSGHGRPLSGEAKASSGSFSLRLGLTSFKHVGVFPEQAPNWEFIYGKCRQMEHPKVLNLFAYTGGASLAALAGGAQVTHLDSVRQVVTWARQNQERSGMDGIRWIVEDAMKFARREVRRGNTYDGIILDPPAYGHGPDGEKWKLDECLFEMLRTVSQILAPHGFVVLNLYSNGYSAALGETLVREAFGIRRDSSPQPVITSGELALQDSFGKVLPLSIVVRLEK
jgi:23S rRNA (cytosine1962-C5)-methyltransferase